MIVEKHRKKKPSLIEGKEPIVRIMGQASDHLSNGLSSWLVAN
jgi:hypothetical protein